MDKSSRLWNYQLKPSSSRTIGIIDLDCFEVQVYLKYRYPNNWRSILNTRPVILTIRNSSMIISLNYVARQMGLSRTVNWKDAKSSTPGLLVLTKEDKYGKPETDRLRKTSQSVYDTIVEFKKRYGMQFVIEFASCDEFYFDFGEDVDEFLDLPSECLSHHYGENLHLHLKKIILEGKQILNRLRLLQGKPKYYNELRLIMAGAMMERLQKDILQRLDLDCSGGVGSNKLLAKLALSYRRPRGITILSDAAVSRYSRTVCIESIPGLKGTTGQLALKNAKEFFQKDEIFMFDLCDLNFWDLLDCLDCDPNFALKVFELVRGRCEDPVVWRSCTKVISSSMRINYNKSWDRNECWDELDKSLMVTCADLSEKLVMDSKSNKRVAKRITATFATYTGSNTFTIYDFCFSDRASICFSLQHEYYDTIIYKQEHKLVKHVRLTANF